MAKRLLRLSDAVLVLSVFGLISCPAGNLSAKPVTKNEEFCVLVLDDDICFTTIVAKALRNGLPDVEVLTARTVAEAQLLLSEFKIHFFILDIKLPDGDGIDFLCDLRTLFPDACAMMITASPLPPYEQQTKELGVLRFRQKPVDSKEIVQLVRSQYEKMGFGTTGQNADGAFAVSLTCLSALDIIQLKCLSSATLVLQVASPSGIGRIFFENGEIVHAETPDSRGEFAFEQILRWKGGRIKEMAPTSKSPRTINTGWQVLLLNVAQRIDESAPVAAGH
jgi:CheY-like chemotaxis protein